MRNKLLYIGILALLTSCAPPPEVTYCQHMGTPQGHPENANCVRYFYEMNNWFQRDRYPCIAQAREVYPDYLYDRGHYSDIDYYGGHSWGGRHGGFPYGGARVRVPPDAWKNAQVDNLRMNLITPCMQAKGWNTGESWEHGRVDGKTRPPKTNNSVPQFLRKR